MKNSIEEIIKGGRRASMPEGVKPVLAKRILVPFDDPGFTFEIKYDGIRALAYKNKSGTRLQTRRDDNANDIFPEIVQFLEQLDVESAIFDGEVIAQQDGQPLGFQELQPWVAPEFSKKKPQGIETAFAIYDVIYINGHDVRPLPLRSRKQILSILLDEATTISAVKSVPEKGSELFQIAKNEGREGIVGKALDAPYEQEHARWVKCKTGERQEFLISGWSENEAGKLSSLFLSAYHPKHKNLHFVGEVIIDQAFAGKDQLRKHLKASKKSATPLVGLESQHNPSYWNEPQYMVEVVFDAWDTSMHIVNGKILGLRFDKLPEDVSLEIPI